jgi:hypothetical protein
VNIKADNIYNIFPKRIDKIEMFGETAKIIIKSNKPSYDKHIWLLSPVITTILNTSTQGPKVEIKPITLFENPPHSDNRTFSGLVCFT